MTQDEVAEKLVVSRPIAVQIEQGKRPISGGELTPDGTVKKHRRPER
jgi:hypothetical protein